MLECVINVSEGQRPAVVEELAATAGRAVLDIHHDPDHHRAVLTLVGVDAPRRITSAAVARLDLRVHDGVHPRLGVVDVVPFVPLGSATFADAVQARNDFARWAAGTLELPCFLYGPERSLPDVRREAFHSLAPDFGPPVPHPTAGACAVGARTFLVAYNLWLEGVSLDRAREIAAAIRSTVVRALAFPVGGTAQVSCNLLEPTHTGPAEVYDAVAALAPIARAELVGLLPAAVLDRIPAARWAALDLAPECTIEARLAAGGWSPAGR